MLKGFACAALALVVLTGFAWSYSAWPAAAHAHRATASSSSDPYSTAEAQRHFCSQPTHWTALLIVLD